MPGVAHGKIHRWIDLGPLNFQPSEFAKGASVLYLAHFLAKKGERVAGGNVAAAKEIGKQIAERAKEKGITKVVFDRGGYLYHGRIKALADAAREAGLEF